jgi:hypothetical protein
MEKYLEILNRIKESKLYQRWFLQLEKIEPYIKGEITSEELVKDTNDVEKHGICSAINKIMTYEEKPVRYYIKLLSDYMPCIIAGEVEFLEVTYNRISTIGPRAQRQEFPAFKDTDHFYEISGNFSSMPNGAMISYSDLMKIWEKNPNVKIGLFDILKAWKRDLTEEWPGKEYTVSLNQEIIDSIQFVKPAQYLSLAEVQDGDFGTFEELLERKQEASKNESRICRK